ncbi:MAG: YrdB family protein [Actinomycetota bacterium]|nr:YrdB family protein [Actinomycetota bacterium]
MTALLFGLRFLLELCLVAAMALVGWAAFDQPLVRFLSALALAVITAALWGVLLSPRRPVDLPVAARVGVELLLFAAAAAGLAAQGRAVWGLALLVAEAVVVLALFAVGHPPGSDVGVSGSRRPRGQAGH